MLLTPPGRSSGRGPVARGQRRRHASAVPGPRPGLVPSRTTVSDLAARARNPPDLRHPALRPARTQAPDPAHRARRRPPYDPTCTSPPRDAPGRAGDPAPPAGSRRARRPHADRTDRRRVTGALHAFAAAVRRRHASTTLRLGHPCPTRPDGPPATPAARGIAAPASSTWRTASRQVLLLAGLTGAVTGLARGRRSSVITADVLLEAVLDLPPGGRRSPAPGVGLVLAALASRVAGGGRHVPPPPTSTSATSTSRPPPRPPTRAVPLLAAIATLGSAAPLGYEGPSLYAGAAVGSSFQRRLAPVLRTRRRQGAPRRRRRRRVAAIFKAPVTGLVFALEVPYQEDLARRMLLPGRDQRGRQLRRVRRHRRHRAPPPGRRPAAVQPARPRRRRRRRPGRRAPRPALRHARPPRQDLRRSDQPRRAASRPARRARRAPCSPPTPLDDAPLALGPGYDALRWALDPDAAVLAVIALGTLRVIGTTAAVGGGGVGGLFIPLVIQGALVGRAVGGIFDADDDHPVPRRRHRRLPRRRLPRPARRRRVRRRVHRPPRLRRPRAHRRRRRPARHGPNVGLALPGRRTRRAPRTPPRPAAPHGRSTPKPAPSPPDATVEELFWQHLVGTRQQSVAVVDGARYLGLVERRGRCGTSTATRGDHHRRARSCAPTSRSADADWLLRDAIRAMEATTPTASPCATTSSYIGVITTADLVELDEVLDRTTRTDATHATTGHSSAGVQSRWSRCAASWSAVTIASIEPCTGRGRWPEHHDEPAATHTCNLGEHHRRLAARGGADVGGAVSRWKVSNGTPRLARQVCRRRLLPHQAVGDVAQPGSGPCRSGP